MFDHFDTIPACDRQTDRQTDRYLATVHAHAEHRVSKLNGKINKSANK